MDVEIERKKIVYNYRIDLIKVIALFLVVLYHSSFLYDNIGVKTLSLCSVCVPLFFIVNGYLCITPPIQENTNYLIKLKKVLILIVVWSFILVSSIMLIKEEDLTIPIIVKRMVNNDLGYCNWIWFMNTLFILYIFKPVLQIALNYPKIYWSFIAIVFTFVIVFPTLSFISTEILNSVYDISFITRNINPFYGWQAFSLFYFGLGVVLNLHSKIKIKYLFVVLLLSFVSSCVINSFVRKDLDIVWINYNTIWTTALAFSLCFIILKIGKVNSLIQKLIHIIGRNTLGGYLLEAIILSLFRKYEITCHSFYRFILCVVIVFGLSVSISFLFSKTPSVRYLFKV